MGKCPDMPNIPPPPPPRRDPEQIGSADYGFFSKSPPPSTRPNMADDCEGLPVGWFSRIGRWYVRVFGAGPSKPRYSYEWPGIALPERAINRENCRNCGAAPSHDRCSYCGTIQ